MDIQDHNHKANHLDNSIRLLRSLVKTKARQFPGFKPKILIDLALREIDWEHRAKLPKTEALERVITRWRSSQLREQCTERAVSNEHQNYAQSNKEVETFKSVSEAIREKFDCSSEPEDYLDQVLDLTLPGVFLGVIQGGNNDGRLTWNGTLDLSVAGNLRPFLNPVV